ncbi:MAG: RNA polymerase sigma factor [Alphaproteobacteria bacterium]|nr:RNA polymerase sigma factor [Alphaproteobacteria bacterium]
MAACAKAGEREAFDLLVQKYKHVIHQFVRRYVGQADDAYDVLQECFIAAWRGISRYDPERPFLPWLRVIALNKCRDFGRRQSVRRIVLETFFRQSVRRDQVGIDLETETEDAQTAQMLSLDKAIATLPAFYKEPLLLSVVSGLSHQDIAEMLKTTSKAVEMRLYRARKKLLDTVENDKTYSPLFQRAHGKNAE